MTIDSVYENSEELKLSTKIIELDSNLNIEDLKIKFKNCAALKFRNLNEVIVSETNDQIVLNYINRYNWDGGLGITINSGNYYKMVVQFKKGKIRITTFDDGNNFIAGSSSTPSVPAHSKHYRDYFRYRTEVFNKGLNKPTYRSIKGYIELNRAFNKSLEEDLRKPTEPILKDDW